MAIQERKGTNGGMDDIHMDKTGNENPQGIKDAINKLNSAAKAKQQEVSSVLSSRYDSLRQRLSDVKENGRTRISEYKQKTSDAVHAGGRAVKEKASSVNFTVHENPWPIIGGAALAGIGIGMAIAWSLKKDSSPAAKRLPAKVEIPASRSLTTSGTRGRSAARHTPPTPKVTA